MLWASHSELHHKGGKRGARTEGAVTAPLGPRHSQKWKVAQLAAWLTETRVHGLHFLRTFEAHCARRQGLRRRSRGGPSWLLHRSQDAHIHSLTVWWQHARRVGPDELQPGKDATFVSLRVPFGAARKRRAGRCVQRARPPIEHKAAGETVHPATFTVDGGSVITRSVIALGRALGIAMPMLDNALQAQRVRRRRHESGGSARLRRC